MFWPGYTTPAQSPWALAPDMNMNATPTTPWSIHPPNRSAFELPLLRADVPVYEDPSDDVSKPECAPSEPVAVLAEIKEERISPEPPSDLAEKVDDASSSAQPEKSEPMDSTTAADQGIRVRNNLTAGWVSQDPSSARSPKSPVLLDAGNSPSPILMLSAAQQEQQENSMTTAADYSGLQLLSDSIERFVSADQAKLAYQPEPIKTEKDHQRSSDNPMTVEVAGNALDVLCAAALYQQSDPSTTTTTTMTTTAAIEPREMVAAAASCIPRPTGFQMEFDFRSKLAELQRKYKEKQKELSSLSESFHNSQRSL